MNKIKVQKNYRSKCDGFHCTCTSTFASGYETTGGRNRTKNALEAEETSSHQKACENILCHLSIECKLMYRKTYVSVCMSGRLSEGGTRDVGVFVLR